MRRSTDVLMQHWWMGERWCNTWPVECIYTVEWSVSRELNSWSAASGHDLVHHLPVVTTWLRCGLYLLSLGTGLEALLPHFSCLGKWLPVYLLLLRQHLLLFHFYVKSRLILWSTQFLNFSLCFCHHNCSASFWTRWRTWMKKTWANRVTIFTISLAVNCIFHHVQISMRE